MAGKIDWLERQLENFKKEKLIKEEE